MIERLIARADALATFPNSGRQVPEFDNLGIRELIEGNSRIVYRVVSRERVDYYAGSSRVAPAQALLKSFRSHILLGVGSAAQCHKQPK